MARAHTVDFKNLDVAEKVNILAHGCHMERRASQGQLTQTSQAQSEQFDIFGATFAVVFGNISEHDEHLSPKIESIANLRQNHCNLKCKVSSCYTSKGTRIEYFVMMTIELENCSPKQTKRSQAPSMVFPCSCHVIATCLPRVCHTVAMLLPCLGETCLGHTRR